MARLLVHVEGSTEEGFVKNLLAPHLARFGFDRVSARLLGNCRQRSRRGGARPWPAVRAEIIHAMKEDRQCLATTMVDYYGMPFGGRGGWPGRDVARTERVERRAGTVEAALAADVVGELEDSVRPDRFLPFVMMHEFEALLFSDCHALAAAMGDPGLEPPLRAIRVAFRSPEEIDDSPQTAPSKRILGLCAAYQKALFGATAADTIGLAVMRRECPHFDLWLKTLESVGQTGLYSTGG